MPDDREQAAGFRATHDTLGAAAHGLAILHRLVPAPDHGRGFRRAVAGGRNRPGRPLALVSHLDGRARPFHRDSVRGEMMPKLIRLTLTPREAHLLRLCVSSEIENHSHSHGDYFAVLTRVAKKL